MNDPMSEIEDRHKIKFGGIIPKGDEMKKQWIIIFFGVCSFVLGAEAMLLINVPADQYARYGDWYYVLGGLAMLLTLFSLIVGFVCLNDE